VQGDEDEGGVEALEGDRIGSAGELAVERDRAHALLSPVKRHDQLAGQAGDLEALAIEDEGESFVVAEVVLGGIG
jgi:hypothetical protein